MDSLCLRNSPSRRSPVTDSKRWANCLKNSDASLQTGPNVSIATGTKMYLWPKEAYFRLFSTAARSAAHPDVKAVWLTYDSAAVQETVTSHIRDFPLDHGVIVIPSGLTRSSRLRSFGSRVDGIFALRNDLCSI